MINWIDYLDEMLDSGGTAVAELPIQSAESSFQAEQTEPFVLLREAINRAAVVEDLDPVMDATQVEFDNNGLTQAQAEALAQMATNRAQQLATAAATDNTEADQAQRQVDGFNGSDAVFNWKALEAHQRGWDKLYWQGQTFTIEQQTGRLSLHPDPGKKR